MSTPRWTLAIHGGSGRMTRDTISPAVDRGVRNGLGHALDAGTAILASGGSALDAVEAAVRALEDDPHFNAGRGAVLTHAGTVELDAAIMAGRDRSAGAVAAVTATRNPVSLARAVMEHSPHVFLAGSGADAFAHAQHIERADADWFVTDERRANLADLLTRGDDAFDVDMKYGTVGAVARDAHGHLAAATSTGGVTGKRWGRIGDSPVIGAGTWADGSAGVSATGAGEYFLRANVASQIATRIRLLGQTPADAADAVLAEVTALGGTGGVIVAGADGEPIWRFTTPGMNRASASSDTARIIAIYDDE